jgi:hypothetical protein
MRSFNPFRSKHQHESSHRITTSLKTNSTSNYTTPINISAPIINCSDKVVINDKDQSNENPNQEQTIIIENDNIEEQITMLEEEPKDMSDDNDHIDDQVD